MQSNIFKVHIAHSIALKLSAFDERLNKENKNYCIRSTRRKMKKSQMLILTMSFNVVKHLCKKLLNHTNIIEMYNQKVFFEHIYVDETHREIGMIVTKSRMCKQFSRINKFFIIDILFEQSLKAMWCWIKCLSYVDWRKIHRNIRNRYHDWSKLVQIDVKIHFLQNHELKSFFRSYEKLIKTWNNASIYERQLHIQHLRSMLQLFFLSRDFQKFRMHDKSFVKLKLMRYRETICYLKSKNLQHVNELMKRINKKTRKLHDKRMKRWQQKFKDNSNSKSLQSQFKVFNWFMKVRLSRMMNSFSALHDYHIHFYNYELIETEMKKKKWTQLNSRSKVYDLQTIDSFYEREIETLINTINNSKMIVLKSILNKNEDEKMYIICMSSVNVLLIYWICFLCDLYCLTTRMLTIFLMIRQSSRCQRNDYNYKRHEFKANNVYRAYVQWRISVHEETFKCIFISSDRNYNGQARYESQFAILMSNTYSVRSRMKKKERETGNRTSFSHRTKKTNKIICVIYGQDDRRSNSYIAKKSRSCFDENDV